MKVILVDDEILALDFLEFQINKIHRVEVIAKYNNLEVIKKSALIKEADVIFLDIEMPEMNGIELAEKILEINTNISIVFVTAYNTYAVEAFELNALDYVLKPVELDRLRKTLERMEEKIQNQKQQPKEENIQLRINVSRELSFEFSNGKLEFIQWRTTKTQELFLYLLHHGEKTVRKSELVELLWSDFNQDRAYSQLYTAIYHLRKSLKKYSDHFIIKNVGEGYNLSTKNVLIDLLEWESKITLAPPVTIETIDDYENNMQLYQGAYLQEYDYLWTETERYRLEQLFLKVAYKIANYYDEKNQLEKAETWYVKICQVRPEDENARFSLMKLYDTLGLSILVDRQYIELDKALSELNLQINTEIKTWFRHWKNHRNSHPSPL
ncbi:response regulator [Oceanobacillus bengalensis]|uniref:Response regulator n=1 Tax=Oceanobacillus bengalensis TaxID=1435466 RepID=A0A494YS83_9BACI|nr:response regulator [Oceanobacillus bengalensis]RKQ12751.1 response regulator [Oceanobacillus bengalensis]